MNAGSLRVRVTLWYVGLLAAALLVFGAAVYLGLDGYLENSLQHSLLGQADAIANQFVAQEESKGPAWMVQEVVESYAPESSGRFIRITRSDGVVLYASGNSRDPFIDASLVPSANLASNTPFFRRENLNRSARLLLYTFPYVAPSGTRYIIETGASRTTIDRVLRSLFFTLLLLTPLILFGAAIGGYLVMTRPLRPVVALTEHAERIGTHSFGERLPVVPTGDELERLSLALNRMISRLEDALTHNQRFSTDVSHELRTPLTILRGEFEHMVQLPLLPPPVLDTIGSAIEEIDRLSKIVDSMLDISKIDSGGAHIKRAPVDLSLLAASTVEQMRLLTEEKHISVVCTQRGPVVVLGDDVRLKQVLVNLLDNAIKYTGLGGRVDIAVTSSGGEATVQVSDDGIGIPSASLLYVFERFYRADKARSRESGGSGLGLSIVKAICTAHRGAVSISSVEGFGTQVTVTLPLLDPAALYSLPTANFPRPVGDLQATH